MSISATPSPLNEEVTGEEVAAEEETEAVAVEDAATSEDEAMVASVAMVVTAVDEGAVVAPLSTSRTRTPSPASEAHSLVKSEIYSDPIEKNSGTWFKREGI